MSTDTNPETESQNKTIIDVIEEVVGDDLIAIYVSDRDPRGGEIWEPAGFIILVEEKSSGLAGEIAKKGVENGHHYLPYAILDHGNFAEDEDVIRIL